MSENPQLRIHRTPDGDPLDPWMYGLLKFVGCYNVLAGLGMIVLYHEGFKMLGLAKPDMNLPIQLVGMMVALFGVGYWIVARNPIENRNVLLLGFWSKFLGSVLAAPYVISGQLPMIMIPIVLLADVIYLVPFWRIYQRCRAAAELRQRTHYSNAA
ncbi:MAG: hypothetical protein ACR2NP_09195 [Pirellulaceae bacterium]